MATPLTPENQHIAHWAAIRFVHNVVGAPDVDIYLDQKLIASGVSQTNVSQYVSVTSGHHHLSVHQAGTESRIIEHRTVIVETYQYYTVIIHGSIKSPGDIDAALIKDNNSCPVNGKAHLRFVHTAYNTPPVDVWLDGNRIFRGVSYQHTGAPAYLPVGLGNHYLSVTYTNTNNYLLQNVLMDFQNQNIYTVLAAGNPRDVDQPFKLVIAEDDRLC